MKNINEILEYIDRAEQHYSNILNKDPDEFTFDESCHYISAISQLETLYWVIGKTRPEHNNEK